MQEKSKLPSNKAAASDQQKLLQRSESKSREITPKINTAVHIHSSKTYEENNNITPQRTAVVASQDDSSIQKIKVKPALPPRGIHQKNQNHKSQEIFTIL